MIEKMAQWKNTGGLKQKHKKQPFSDACASHLSLANQRDGSFGMPLAYTNQKNRPFGLWFVKIVNEVKVLWRLVAVGNGILWLTPCKRMKLRRSE